MDTDLPVWTIRPNWRDGVLERLEWLTDVLTSSVGAEQRRSVRVSPRRSIEITVNPTMQERTYLDLLLHSLGGEDWLFPLWFDKGRMTERALVGATRVDFDNTFREHRAPGLALIHRDTFSWEVISISGQDDDGVDLDVPLDQEWGPGTAIYPLRQAKIMADTSLSALSSQVGESVLLFMLHGANDWPETMPDTLMYEGLPVMTLAPNRASAITTDHTRLQSNRDGQVGLIHRASATDRAFAVQSHSWMRHGRQAQAEFRSMLYWLRGRQRAVLLPTFNEDVVTARDAAAGAVNLNIRRIGISYTGVVAGRDLVKIGNDVLKLTATAAPLATGEERLVLSAGLPQAIPAGRRGAFLAAARLDQDTLELKHHADTNGAMECSATFRTFANIRQSAGTIRTPIPVGIKTPWACGFGAFEPVFEGWYMKVRVEWFNASTPAPGLGYNIAGYGGAGTISYVDGPPEQVEVDFEYIEFTFFTEGSYNVQDWELLLQFRNSSVSADMRGRLTYRRWDVEDYAVSVPFGDSWSTSDPFDVRSLFPSRYYFTF